MSRRTRGGKRIAVLYTSGLEILGDIDEKMRATMDLAVNARAVAEALESAGHVTRTFAFDPEIGALIAGLRSFGPDLVFNLSEGPLNSALKEPHGAALLELLRFPYTGNGPLALAVCNDKTLTKRILAHHGISTPAFRLCPRIPRGGTGLAFPVIVKPANEDGSAGITEESVVDTAAGLAGQVARVLRKHGGEALVEEFVGGREFNVAILGNGTAADPYRPLPPAELLYHSPKWRVCSFESKWDHHHPSYHEITAEVPAKIPARLRRRLRELTAACARIFRLSGYARVDFRLGPDGEPSILEVNPNPDISVDAGLARAAEAAGLSYGDLVLEVVRLGAVQGVR